MTESTSTTVSVPGRPDIVGIPGVKSEQQIRTIYGPELNLDGLSATESDVNGVHYVEFTRRTGTKG